MSGTERTSGPTRDGAGDGADGTGEVTDGTGDCAGDDASDGGRVGDAGATPAAEVLGLLADDHARAVLRAVGGGPATGVELVGRLDASRATVYRRLNALEEAGLVESTVRYDPDGHHRRVYRRAVEAVTVELDADGPALARLRRRPED